MVSKTSGVNINSKKSTAVDVLGMEVAGPTGSMNGGILERGSKVGLLLDVGEVRKVELDVDGTLTDESWPVEIGHVAKDVDVEIVTEAGAVAQHVVSMAEV